MSFPTLPASREFITHLFNSLSTLPQPFADATTHVSNALSTAPEPARKQLLTLHVLFPNELLPAFDLLDRRLVIRFRIRDSSGNDAQPHITEPREAPCDSHDSEVQVHTAQEEGSSTTQHGDMNKAKNTVYYVRSAQQRSSRFSTSYDSTTSYEVRLHAWNCSCPAFAFAAFPTTFSDVPVSAPNHADEFPASGTGKVQQHGEWNFGAMSLGSAIPPVCKHLLACVLAERCAMFEPFIEEREVTVDEAAGWAAGWGD